MKPYTLKLVWKEDGNVIGRDTIHFDKLIPNFGLKEIDTLLAKKWGRKTKPICRDYHFSYANLCSAVVIQNREVLSLVWEEE